MSKDFYQLCYDQYQREMKEADNIYQRAGVMVIVLPLLGTATVTLGRIEVLKLCFTRVDIFLYCIASLTAILSILISVVFLFSCVYPRKYQTLSAMNVWQKWREDYQEYLKNIIEGTESNNVDTLDTAMINNLCGRLVEAQPINAGINEKRRKAFQKSLLMAGIALAVICLQSLFFLVLKIQGV